MSSFDGPWWRASPRYVPRREPLDLWGRRPVERREVAPQPLDDEELEPTPRSDRAVRPAPPARASEAPAAAPAPIATNAPDKEALRRALADLEAAKQRTVRQAESAEQETRAKLVMDLLPVLDNLDRTLLAASGAPGGSDQALLQGVEMVRAQLEQVLLRYGVERIESAGKTFDPALHHAIAIAPTDAAGDGRVVNQLEAGYRHAGKVLRPAKVVVGRHGAADAD